jgi:predicted nucleotidyltransferase
MLQIETDTLKGLYRPVDYRDVGSLLDRMAQSRLILQLLRKEVERMRRDAPKSHPRQSFIAAFGSVSRGEYDPVYSDIDLMFLDFEPALRTALLKRLTFENQCLPFDDLTQLLVKKSHAATRTIDLRFPCFNRDVLFSQTEPSRRRRIQFLLESVPISEPEHHAAIMEQIIEHYGLVPYPKIRQRPNAFIDDLEAYYHQMQQETALKDGKGSDYFIKYLIVRVLGQHLTRLSLIQATLSRHQIRTRDNPALGFADVLRKPSLVKLLFWDSQDFLARPMLRRLKEDYCVLLNKTIREALAAANVDQLAVDPNTSVDTLIGLVVRNAARGVSDTLDLLHSSELRQHLQKSKANFVVTSTDPDHQLIIHQIRKTVRWFRALSEILYVLFPLADSVGAMNKMYAGSGLETAVNYFHDKAVKDPYA